MRHLNIDRKVETKHFLVIDGHTLFLLNEYFLSESLHMEWPIRTHVITTRNEKVWDYVVLDM